MPYTTGDDRLPGALPFTLLYDAHDIDPTHGQATSVAEIVAQSAQVAESFVTKYYAAQDTALLDTRPSRVSAFYSPQARITWNGNGLVPADLDPFMQRMPKSKTDVQSVDCHPISGSSTGGPPSLAVTVTGSASYGDYVPSTQGQVPKSQFDFLPRTFSQSFVLVYDPTSPPTAKDEDRYKIAADSFRFV